MYSKIKFNNRLKIGAGMSHTLFLTKEGVLHYGEHEPVDHKVIIKGEVIIGVFAKISMHSLFLCKSGNLFGSGNNECHQLGFDSKSRNTPTVVKNVSFFNNKRIKDVFVGYRSSFVLTSEALYSFGSNRSAQLSLGIKKFSKNISIPTKIQGPIDENNLRSMDIGYMHTLFLRDNGEVYACGNKRGGACGVEADVTIKYIHKATKMKFEKRCKNIAAGGYHTILLCTDGKVYGCGNVGEGQQGRGKHPTKKPQTPTLINYMKDKYVVSVMCSFWGTAFKTRNGDFFVCGGGLGKCMEFLGEKSHVWIPKKVPGGQKFFTYTGGMYNTIFVAKVGFVHSSGSGGRNQIGNNDKLACSTLTKRNIKLELCFEKDSFFINSIFKNVKYLDTKVTTLD